MNTQYIYNLREKKEKTIDSNPLPLEGIDIFGDKIVWVECTLIENTYHNYLVLYNLSSKTKKIINTQNASVCHNPALHENYILYSDWGSLPFCPGGHSIYLYNCSSETSYLLRDFQCLNGDIYGEFVVWREFNATIIYNLTANVIMKRYTFVVSHIRIYKNFVAWDIGDRTYIEDISTSQILKMIPFRLGEIWEDRVVGISNGNILLFNITTNEMKVVEKCDATEVSIYGDIIAYIAPKHGKRYVYIVDLSNTFKKELTEEEIMVLGVFIAILLDIACIVYLVRTVTKLKKNCCSRKEKVGARRQ